MSAGSDDLGQAADLELDLDISAGTVVKDLELEVEPFGAIEGQVVDEAGEPLGGALVAAYDGRSVVQHAKAASTAAYRIEGLLPGWYLVQFLGRAPYVKEGGGGDEIDEQGLPPPSEFFERPVRVEPGRTSRWDVDLSKDGLGAIEGVVSPDLKGAALAGCALLAGGRPRGGIAFGNEDVVRDNRFRLEPLRPGVYRVCLTREGEGMISEADVTVKAGRPTRLVMPVPTGSLVIPIEGVLAPRLSEARVATLVRWEPYRRQDGPVATEVAAGQVAIAGGGLRLDGLVSGSLQATVLVPGFEAFRTEPVWVAQGSESAARPLVLASARSIRVRLELADGLKLPEEPTFRVVEAGTEAEALVSVTRSGEGLLWTLSGFPAGAFTISVDAGSAFREASADVNSGDEEEVTIRLERRLE